MYPSHRSGGLGVKSSTHRPRPAFSGSIGSALPTLLLDCAGITSALIGLRSQGGNPNTRTAAEILGSIRLTTESLLLLSFTVVRLQRYRDLLRILISEPFPAQGSHRIDNPAWKCWPATLAYAVPGLLCAPQGNTERLRGGNEPMILCYQKMGIRRMGSWPGDRRTGTGRLSPHVR